MSKNKNKIRERVFSDFEKALTIFYRKRQQKYFKQLKEKIENGFIDVEDPEYRKITWREAESFMASRPKELLEFIKQYVDGGIDEIQKSLKNQTITKEESETIFEVFKYLLLAGENEVANKK